MATCLSQVYTQFLLMSHVVRGPKDFHAPLPKA